MRIVFVLGSAILGGAERQAVITASYLRKQHNSEVQVVLFRNPGGPVSRLCEEYELPWVHIPFSDLGKTIYPYQILKYSLQFRKLKPDVIISYTDGPNTLCGLIWKWTGARLFIWSQRHSHTFPRFPFIMQKALYNTRVVISNSQEGIDNLKKEYPDATKNIRFYKIHNGVALPAARFSAEKWRQRLGISSDTIVVLMIANLSFEFGKDHTTLLRAWEMVIDAMQRQGKRAVLLLAGQFHTKTQDLINLSLELGIFSSVRFLGKVDDITGLAHASDILVHSATQEGIPNGVLEGMAAALPVVATDISGIREAVGSENYEWLCPPHSAFCMAEKILKLAADPALRKQIGLHNQNRIHSEFSVSRLGEQTWNVIQENFGK
jgi:glycosyltransferase involved in cell wall biosynthesis